MINFLLKKKNIKIHTEKPLEYSEQTSEPTI